MKRKEPRRLPILGWRIIKTGIAVFICLIIYWLRGYYGADMPTESAITAIICMQPYVRDTKTYSLNRVAGTLVGTFWGLFFLALLLFFPILTRDKLFIYGFMALGTMASLYGAVVLGMSDAAGLAAIVFLFIVIAFPEIEDLLGSTLRRILDVFIGTTVAIAVNVFRLPRTKRRNKVFFVRTKDLVPDRFGQLPAAALFRLNYLYDDGAKLCLMSEHAPAFFTQQMSAAKVNVPLIVMDGAAIYDIHENRYLWYEPIPTADSLQIRAALEALGLGWFVYTVHRDKTCIFHRGKLSIEEKLVLDRLKRSPYRSYLEGESYELSEVVYYKIIALDRDIERIKGQLLELLPPDCCTMVIRSQNITDEIVGLYLYSRSLSLAATQERLMALLRAKEPKLEPVDVQTKAGYRSERDAMHLLTRVENLYEPVRLFHRTK